MSWLQSFDSALFCFLNQKMSHPGLDAIIPLFSGFPLFMPLVVLCGAVLFWKGGKRERLFVVMLILVLSVGEGLVIGPMKELVARSRPFNVITETHLLVGRGGSGSMPSSHSSNWFAAAMVAFLFYRRSWRFMLPMACMVGFSRIYVGVHYPSDVLAGAILGAGYAAGVMWSANWLWQIIGPAWFNSWWQSMPTLAPGLPESSGTGATRASAPSPALAGTGITDLQWLRLGYGVIAVFLTVQLFYIGSKLIELSGDEAYQWMWSKHLALSYYSKPPMIAYLQFLGTSLWGDNAFGVRFFSPVIAAILCLLLLRFIAREVSARAGFWLVVMFICSPLLGVGATLMTVDPPLVLFWVAAMIAGWRAVQPESTVRNWFWVGLWMGLGFLSKYSMLFQLLCWAVFFALYPPARVQLRRAGPYLALGILALSTLPVIIWNAQHSWITVQHVAYDNAGFDKQWEFKPKLFAEFMGSALGLMNPVFFCAAVIALFCFWRRYRQDKQNSLFVYFFSMGTPVFVVYMLFTVWKRVLPNWIAPAIVPMFCLTVLYFDRRWKEGLTITRKWLTAGVIIGGFIFVLLHDTNLTNKMFARTLPVPLDPLRRVRAWSTTAQVVEEARTNLLARGKPVFVIASGYALAGELNFYIPEARKVAGNRMLVYCPTATNANNQFYFWPGYKEQRRGENALYVHELDLPKLAKGWFWKWLRGDNDFYAPPKTQTQPPNPEIFQEFTSVRSIGAYNIEYRGRIMRRIEIYVCRNLR